MKKIITLILVLSMALMLFSCGATKEKVIGTWQRETMYLPAYNCEADMIISFGADGTYAEVLLNHVTGDILDTESGRWTIEGGEVAARETGEDGTTYYSYSGGHLKNGDNKYTRISD